MRGNGSRLWRGEWYVYNFRTQEFVREISYRGRGRFEGPRAARVRWTPGLRYARAYKNPHMAQLAANRLNEALEADGRGDVRVVTMVTGEAARCLDAINRRDARGTTKVRGV